VQLYLEFPTEQSGDEQSKRARAIFELLRIPGRLLREHRLVVEAKVTITGRLELKDVYRQVTIDRDRPYGAGFGHLGAFPGKLQVERIRELLMVFPNQ
jgi:hypothetical protein